ncbi:hypothetical protein MRX96_026350 [Rhipicephalus microplus]
MPCASGDGESPSPTNNHTFDRRGAAYRARGVRFRGARGVFFRRAYSVPEQCGKNPAEHYQGEDWEKACVSPTDSTSENQSKEAIVLTEEEETQEEEGESPLESDCEALEQAEDSTVATVPRRGGLGVRANLPFHQGGQDEEQRQCAEEAPAAKQCQSKKKVTEEAWMRDDDLSDNEPTVIIRLNPSPEEEKKQTSLQNQRQQQAPTVTSEASTQVNLSAQPTEANLYVSQCFPARHLEATQTRFVPATTEWPGVQDLKPECIRTPDTGSEDNSWCGTAVTEKGASVQDVLCPYGLSLRCPGQNGAGVVSKTHCIRMRKESAAGVRMVLVPERVIVSTVFPPSATRRVSKSGHSCRLSGDLFQREIVPGTAGYVPHVPTFFQRMRHKSQRQRRRLYREQAVNFKQQEEQRLKAIAYVGPMEVGGQRPSDGGGPSRDNSDLPLPPRPSRCRPRATLQRAKTRST